MSAWKTRVFARGRSAPFGEGVALNLYSGHGVDLTASEARALADELKEAADEVAPRPMRPFVARSSLDTQMHELARARGLIQRACDKCGHPIEAYASDASSSEPAPTPSGDWSPPGGWVCAECGGRVQRAKPRAEATDGDSLAVLAPLCVRCGKPRGHAVHGTGHRMATHTFEGR